MLIVAGVDSNGVDYNTGAWVVPGGGAGLRLEPDGSLRSVQLRDGKVIGIANPMSYHRPHTRDSFTVPFEVSGEILLHSRATDPFIFGENRAPTWTWGVNFHPVFVDEDNNVVTGFAPSSPNWSASGQVDGKYGIARAERYTPPFDHDSQHGTWHRWRMVVPAVGTHEVYWDDELVYRVVEKSPPAAWWTRPLHAGMRLDFYDYSLRNLNPPMQEEVPVSRYLTDLADVLRGAGVNVLEVLGWERRARSSGGYTNGQPSHLMVHHTASPHSSDGVNDVNYIIGSPDAPITNLYLDRAGTFWVCAAGATNTNGKGVDIWGGGVPVNRMNEHAVSVEIANNGVGEPYPAAQQDALVRGCVALCRAYGIPPHRVRAHFEWAPTRKTDPSGPSMWAASGKWAMDEFRDDIAAGLTPPLPPPPPTPEDTDMLLIVVHNNVDPKETWLTWTGAHLAHVVGHAAYIHAEAKTKRIDITDDKQANSLIQSSQTVTACPPEWVGTPRGAIWTAQRG